MQILGISFDTVEENAAFAKKFSFNYPLLCDVDRKIGLAYHATEDPKSGSAKRIAYVIGPDGRIQQAFGKVDSKALPAQLAASL